MPRYKVTETRAFTNVFLIDAEDEAAAGRYDGDVVEESPDADSYVESTDEVEQVGDNALL